MTSARGLPRRGLLLAALAMSTMQCAPALPLRTLRFPRDFGSHPEMNIEWWYITGHARSGTREFGFQITFFRSRVEATQTLRSAFAAKQLLFAHLALTDLEGRRLLHDQRIARTGFDIAATSEADTDIRLHDWSLVRIRAPGGSYHVHAPAGDFALDLRFTPTQSVLLQGDAGLSRKGPELTQASYYYSEPQLAAQGRLTLQGQNFDVTGTAWLDHEWSAALMPPDAVGWDWTGMNLHDGSALTAFRLRDRQGHSLWGGGSFRTLAGNLRVFQQDEVGFEPLRWWRSPATQTRYPVEWALRTPSGLYMIKARLDDQELDSRASTGALYWEGLSELLAANGQRVGQGYLEMTGYAKPLRL